MCRILQGRDVRSVHVLVPDSRGLKQDFHDVTIVDMADLPESPVSMDELSLLRRQWPPTVLRHMVWLQQNLDTMRAEAKKRFRNVRPTQCSYCNKCIKCDVYRHVATYHYVSWCTVWKGIEGNTTGLHGSSSGVHDVPWDVKSANLEKFVPQLTVQPQVWSDSLTANHSGISTDVLLFSDIQPQPAQHINITATSTFR